MTSFYKMEHATTHNDRVGRTVGPVDSAQFIRFIDALRERGTIEAMPLFPMQWEWYNQLGDPTLDWLPAAAAGLVLSEKAYRAVSAFFPKQTTVHATIQLEGTTYHWLAPTSMRGDSNDMKTLGMSKDTAVVTVMPGAITVCRDALMQAWTAAGLTGATFSPLPT